MSCAVGLLFLAFSFSSALFGTSFAFCPPGCECHDDSLGVTCNFSGLTAIPILLNPMLKSLRIRNSNGLKLDTFSIALYQDLESLELSDCQIAHLPAGIFSQLPMLRQLILHGNKLKRLDPEVFGRIDTLEMLDLSSNQLERIEPSTFGGLASLRSLNLSSNQLHILPANFLAGLHSLRILLLDRNRMSKVPDSQMLANGTGSSRLEELSLAGNILSELPSDAFVALPALTRLDLSANLISHIESNAFAGLEALLDLNLTRNLLSISPQNADQSWVDWPPTLERLDLSGNAWTQIRPGTFAGLRSLRELALEEMSQLTDIQADAFAELPSLERISLANSAFLSAIDPRAFDWQQPEHLQHLDLSNCHLSTLDAKMLSDWATLKTLKLSGNRWICDCHLLAFLPQILRRQQGQGEDQLLGENVLCNEPEHLRDQKLVDFGTNANLPEQAECLAQSEDNSPGLPFLLLCSAAGLFMLASSLGLLLCCFWPNRQKEGRTDGCCWERCLGKEEADRKACRDQSRTQLYATGSSFTESLIYEKGIGPTIANRPTDHFPSCDGTAGLANNFAATTAAAEAGRRRCENHRGHWRPAAAVGCPKSMAKQQTSVPDWTDGEPDSHTYSCSSSSGDDDYYSSIVAEPQQDLDAVGKQCHRSPPDSPPPPPPPIFSDPPSWPPAALLAMANLPPCQLAAPPYQLRNQQHQMPQGTARCDLSRPPSMYAPQPPPLSSRWTPNYNID